MIKEKEHYNNLVKLLNERRYKKHYKLIDLVEVLGIGYKSLKNMVKDIYIKYESFGTIKKEGGTYQIHYTLLDKFKLKKPRRTTIYSHQWRTNISWTTKLHYTKPYHKFLVSEIMKSTPEANYIHSFEKDDNGRFHVHMLSDVESKQLKPIISKLLTSFIGNWYDYRLYCQPINNRGSSVDYMIKNPQ